MTALFGRRYRLAIALGLAAAVPGALGCQVLVGITQSYLITVETAEGGATPPQPDATVPTDAYESGVAEGASDAPLLVDVVTNGDASDGGSDSSLVSDAADAGGDADAEGEGEAAIDAAPICTPAAAQCSGNTAQICEDGGWVDQTVCPALCSQGTCEIPVSCAGIAAWCDTDEQISCCSSHVVTGGPFFRSYDETQSAAGKVYPATVNDFILDDFEVTTTRFANFLNAYPVIPSAGAGKNPSDPTDQGWDAGWPLPPDRATLEASLSSCASNPGTTWGTPSALPVNCVDWFVAFAFCIWDGGRLPTEAEWNYAAAGGSLQLTFPWSTSFADESFTAVDAVFYPSPIEPVGSKLPNGVGKWLQADLVGNVSEWVRDTYQSPYEISDCENCAYYDVTGSNVYRGADYTFANDGSMAASERFNADPGQPAPTIGIRCAR